MNNSTDDNSAKKATPMASNSSGKWIIAVIIAGAAWVAISPFLGAILAKDEHLKLSGKPPVPYDFAKAANSADGTNSSSSLSGMGLSKSGIGSGQSSDLSAKANAETIRDRFRRSIVALKPDRSSSSAYSGTLSGLGERLKQLTALNEAKQDEAVLAQIDLYLTDADKTPGALPEYKIIAAGLAMQSAARLHKLDMVKYYGKVAKSASRANGNYYMRELDAGYYSALGSNVDFSALRKLTGEYEADVAASRLPDALEKSKRLVALTDSLPSESYYRMQARIYKAHSQYISDLDEGKARRELLEIKKDALANDDKDWVKVCDNLINSLGGPI
ncbi:hypothetical protein BH11CYA1_BH11CYA1_38240 [soil metagenome]